MQYRSGSSFDTATNDQASWRYLTPHNLPTPPQTYDSLDLDNFVWGDAQYNTRPGSAARTLSNASESLSPNPWLAELQSYDFGMFTNEGLMDWDPMMEERVIDKPPGPINNPVGGHIFPAEPTTISTISSASAVPIEIQIFDTRLEQKKEKRKEQNRRA
jgi:hypothetical protein